MGVYETYSKRLKKTKNQGEPDVYQYDVLPEPFRVQVVHIWTTALGQGAYVSGNPPRGYWSFICDTLARELGVFELVKGVYNDEAQCRSFLLGAPAESALDIIELSFLVIDKEARNLGFQNCERVSITQSADDAIDELNRRFREHSLGYRFEGGHIIRIDTEYIHQEAVRPTLSLLRERGFIGAEEEFVKAHEHYRHGRNKEAIAEALKAFESTMKAICDAHKWEYPPGATAKPLIDLLFVNDLVPSKLQSQLAGLRVLLESGLPTVSNTTSRHGQGTERVSVEDHVAAYALHMAASNIVFLVEAHKARKATPPLAPL